MSTDHGSAGEAFPLRSHPVFAALYDRVARPLERAVLAELRAGLLGEATGAILDVGAGTGANLPYLRHASRVVATEPDAAMRRRLDARRQEAPVSVEVHAAPAEALPFPDATFDTAVFTCVLCTVPDPAAALAEARRVLRPGGRLAVLEHVRATGRRAAWQDGADRLWSALGGGCRPNRDTAARIEEAGFAFDRCATLDLLPRWVPTNPWLVGIAVRGA